MRLGLSEEECAARARVERERLLNVKRGGSSGGLLLWRDFFLWELDLVGAGAATTVGAGMGAGVESDLWGMDAAGSMAFAADSTGPSAAVASML